VQANKAGIIAFTSPIGKSITVHPCCREITGIQEIVEALGPLISPINFWENCHKTPVQIRDIKSDSARLRPGNCASKMGTHVAIDREHFQKL
jgi:hypothetical protein